MPGAARTRGLAAPGESERGGGREEQCRVRRVVAEAELSRAAAFGRCSRAPAARIAGTDSGGPDRSRRQVVCRPRGGSEGGGGARRLS